jgi:8-amino-7-oxononanoate synthase
MGVFGERGRGLAEAVGVEDQVDFVVGTFSKSLGSIGGFCVSSRPELELARFAARSYIFTASPTPSIVASTRVTLQRVAAGKALRDQLWANSRRLYQGLSEAGFRLGPEPGPVVAVFVDCQETAINWWHQLLDDGVYVNLVMPPATPSTSCLLRCSISAAHTPEQVDRIIDRFSSLLAAPRAASTIG